MRSRVKKGFLLTLGALLFSAAREASALAQCSMCKASVQAGANASVNPQALADTLNLAVLVLLIPPVLIFSALFILLLRYRRSTGEVGAGRLMAADVPD
jgi:hypothetical protein